MQVLLRASLALALVALLAGCASSGDAISKVKIYKLRSDQRVEAADPSIRFEQKHRLHGAVTAEEVREREGNYYTVFWSVADPSQPVTLRFEYKQAATGSRVHTIEVPVEAPRSHNVTDIKVVGQPFAQGGSVVAWRVLLTRGGETLATHQSFLWE